MAYKTLSTKMVSWGGQNLEDMEICHLRGSVGLSQASNAYAILVYPQNMNAYAILVYPPKIWTPMPS